MILKEDLEEKFQLIPISDLLITCDPEKTTGYDITVEDFYTFETTDGIFLQDTMAIYHPITDEAQAQARERMMRVQTGETSSKVTIELSKEMWVGLYIITKDVPLNNKPAVAVSDADLEKANDPFIPVVYRKKTTTMGKALFNSCFPESFPFIEQKATKSSVNKLIYEFMNKFGEEKVTTVISKLKDVGFKFATIMAPSFLLDDLEIPPEILKLKAKLESATTEEATLLIDQMRALLIEHLKGTGLYDLVDSGSTKGWDQPTQILIAKGVIADPTGKVMAPIKGSFSEGLTPTEYFNAASGARKGIMDRVLNTATTGYMSRQLVYVLSPVEADLYLRDCKTDRFLTINVNTDLAKRFVGRFMVGKGGIIEPYNGKTGLVKFRTPIYCRSPKICHTCYGKLLERHRTPYIGVYAATIVGERGTQLIMRSFHTGGAVKIKIRDILKDIVDNDPIVTAETLSSYIRQDEADLVCLKPCTVTMNFEDYDIGDNLLIEETKIVARGLIARVEFEDAMFNLILDYTCHVKISNDNKITKEGASIKFKAEEPMITIPLETSEIREQVLYVSRLLGGREVYRDTEHLFKKLIEVYSPPVADMDSVHLELLLSQCLRDKQRPDLAARLGKEWDPIMMNIKRIVFNSGFVQGLAFENVNEVIRTGLISEREPEPSVIEKIMTGTLIEEEEND